MVCLEKLDENCIGSAELEDSNVHSLYLMPRPGADADLKSQNAPYLFTSGAEIARGEI